MLSKKVFPLVVILATLFSFVPSLAPAFAQEPHQNPETTTTVFSGFALFEYYTETLVEIIAKKPETVNELMDKMPFANIPEFLSDSTNEFMTSTKLVADIVYKVDSDLEALIMLKNQSRLEEATTLSGEISISINTAYTEIDRMERVVVTSGVYFKVPTATAESDIRIAYNRLLELIQRIRNLLDLQASLHQNLTDSLESLTGIESPELTLTVNPTTAFVGENVIVSGSLAYEGKGLGNREIEILLNNETNLTTVTDSQGSFITLLTIPYLYQPELNLQALFYPQGTDTAKYLAALSPMVTIEVLYYEAMINLNVNNRAYPGRELTITGNISYKPLEGNAIAPLVRSIEIYFDNELVKETTATEGFPYSLPLPPDIKLGNHLITFTVSANDRYAPSFTDRGIQVVKAVPYFTGEFPKLLFVPGSFYLQGQLKSETGVLDSPIVNIKLGNNVYNFTGEDNGFIFSNNKTRYYFSLLGSQTLEMVVTPTEPWHDKMVITRQILLINYINCGIFFIVLVIFAIIFPRRFVVSLRQMATKKKASPTSLPAPHAPIYSEVITRILDQAPASPLTITTERLLSLYRIVLKLVQTLTRTLLKPQQTLREYAREATSKLGPISTPFTSFTRLIEKTIYSQQKVTQDDIAEGENLVNKIRQDTTS